LDPLNKTAYFRWIDVLKTFWTSYAEDALQVYYQLESATKETNGYLDDKCGLYVQAALWDQALETCKRGIVQTSPRIETYVNLAKAQAVKESLQDSKKTLKALVTRFPQAVEAHTALADNYFSENNFILAAEHYRISTKLDPSNPGPFLSLAECEFRQKKYVEALEAYKKNCSLSRTLASEFKHATGELRSNYPLHNKYKNVMSSCQK
jgi:tetratricopeptide (TPR) repeat protein